jgi:pSer/pThr/pTyr-binding forkhead associated (FHA) protein
MAVTLRGTHGDWTLPVGETILGRGDKAGLRIPDPRLSRAHARFFVAATGCTVQELGSTNGVLVNGDRVRSAPVRQGDVVVCGPVAFTVALDDRPDPPVITCLRGGSGDPAQATVAGTDTMDPVEVASLSDGQRRGLAPEIAAAVSGIHVPAAAMPTTGSAGHRPGTGSTMIPDEQPLRPGSALTSSEIRPPPAQALPGTPSRSTGLAPMEFAPGERSPLAAGPGTWAHGPGWRGRRIAAGALEAGTVALFAWGGLLAATAGGYAVALVAAGGRLDGGLPTLSGTGDPAGWWTILMTLTGPAGWERAWALVPHLRGTGAPFAWLFAGTMLGLLAWTVAHAWVISATVHAGAPPWHRRLGLVIVRAADGSTCSWPRAALRWVLLGATLPMAAITALAGITGLHDRIAGTRIHDRLR